MPSNASLVSTDGPFELDSGNLILKGLWITRRKLNMILTVKADDGYGGEHRGRSRSA